VADSDEGSVSYERIQKEWFEWSDEYLSLAKGFRDRIKDILEKHLGDKIYTLKFAGDFALGMCPSDVFVEGMLNHLIPELHKTILDYVEETENGTDAASERN
jgi:hypothetical protein